MHQKGNLSGKRFDMSQKENKLAEMTQTLKLRGQNIVKRKKNAKQNKKNKPQNPTTHLVSEFYTKPQFLFKKEQFGSTNITGMRFTYWVWMQSFQFSTVQDFIASSVHPT